MARAASRLNCRRERGLATRWPRRVWKRRTRSESSASACRSSTRSPTATAWRSTGRSLSIPRRRGGAAPGKSARSAAAPLLHGLARLGGLLRDLRVLEVVALALRVGARNALAAFQRAQAFLRTRAVLALRLRILI